MRIRERIAREVGRITGTVPALEFTRVGEGDFSCVLTGGNAGAEQAASAWNASHGKTAHARSRGAYLTFTLTDGALLAEMEVLADAADAAEPDWNGPCAAEIQRLRADRAFGRTGAFSHEAAMAVLKLERGLPAALPAGPLHPGISRALEAVYQKKNRTDPQEDGHAFG